MMLSIFLLLHRMPANNLHSEVKFFTKICTHFFLQQARYIRDISLKLRKPEGLSEGAGDVIKTVGAGAGAVYGTVGGIPGTVTGAKGGKLLGDLLAKGINKILQVSQKIIFLFL